MIQKKHHIVPDHQHVNMLKKQTQVVKK